MCVCVYIWWWCWGRPLRIPWTARRSNQAILKEINPEYSLEGLKVKFHYMATWCKELTHWKRLWCWEGSGAGGEGDNRGWDGWMASWTRWTWVWVNSGRWWWTGRPGMLRLMGSQRVGHDWVTELNWIEALKSGPIPAIWIWLYSYFSQKTELNTSEPTFPSPIFHLLYLSKKLKVVI